MKAIVFCVGFVAGIFFTMKNPDLAAQIAQWVMQNQFMVGLLR